nr:immunoglobulin light chain junction region [Macaca mulatta]MOX80936.1 immunoglobulin light chain junction region [Macaca mulatta]MOX81109.1 immunoglobulin light chain junction region [Macaca mulatta]MOX81249.1 immunoglobulin light chain junction region [Macaca mulatta]MOX81603.1 immunoglobulin light chain junction region [Macaca mulatta]
DYYCAMWHSSASFLI